MAKKADIKANRLAVGRLVSAAIAKSGLSQAEVARRSGLHASQLSFALKGTRGLSAAQLQALASTLAVDVKALLVPPGVNPADVFPTAPRLASIQEANAFDPRDPTPGSAWIQAVMNDVAAGLQLQPGLADYLEANKDRLTLSEAQLLAGHASKPMPGKVLVKDAAYWDRVLEFYRKEFPVALAKSRDADDTRGT